MSFDRSILPASQFNGDSALGLSSKLTIARVTLSIVHYAVQCPGFNTSRHISPVSKCTLGWKTRVKNFIFGGF